MSDTRSRFGKHVTHPTNSSIVLRHIELFVVSASRHEGITPLPVRSSRGLEQPRPEADSVQILPICHRFLRSATPCRQDT